MTITGVTAQQPCPTLSPVTAFLLRVSVLATYYIAHN